LNQKFSVQHTHTLDTGLSDFHHLISTELKSIYTKVPPRKVTYRSYKYFNDNTFLSDLSENLSSSNISNYDIFESIFVEVLNKHAPLKSRFVRGNEKRHMNKALRKAIMRRSRLRNVYLKSQKISDRHAYQRQRNYVTNLNRRAREMYFESAVSQFSNKSHNFWKLCQPFLSENSSNSNNITLVQDEKVLSEDLKIAEAFNAYFSDITKDLNLWQWPLSSRCLQFSNPIHQAISKYEDHPSIIKIRSLFGGQPKFTFSEVNTEYVDKLVISLESKKATSGNISPKFLKLSSGICSSYLAKFFNASLSTSTFPDSLKCASITPIPKKGDATCIKNYRPISILPTVSKIFEKIISAQLGAFFETRFSPFLCGFRKGHSTQHALLRLLHRWQSSLDKSKIVGTVLMDLSKAYDSIPHDLLIAKLAAYGVDNFSLSFILDYLSNRKQRVRINDSFSDFLCIILGVPQGSILGPLLFNIFLNDLILFERESDLCNFADDNTLYAFGSSVFQVTATLKTDIQDILYWFKINQMAANPSKFQVMFLGTKHHIDNFIINNISIPVSTTVKLLGITIDKELKFKLHTEELSKIASNKTKALFRIRPFLSLKTSKALFHAYILSTFKYCPLIWMNFIKGNYTRIEKIHHRALSAVFNTSLSFSELLALEGGVSLHIYFIKNILVEIFKSLHGLNPTFLSELFIPKCNPYSLRSGHQLILPPTNTVLFGTRSLGFMGSLLWNRLPKQIKESTSLSIFKNNLNKLSVKICYCQICNI